MLEQYWGGFGIRQDRIHPSAFGFLERAPASSYHRRLACGQGLSFAVSGTESRHPHPPPSTYSTTTTTTTAIRAPGGTSSRKFNPRADLRPSTQLLLAERCPCTFTRAKTYPVSEEINHDERSTRSIRGFFKMDWKFFDTFAIDIIDAENWNRSSIESDVFGYKPTYTFGTIRHDNCLVGDGFRWFF